MSVPASVRTDESVDIYASITNLGTKSVARNDAGIELIRLNDNKVVYSGKLASFAAFQNRIVKLTDRLNNSFDSDVNYKVNVVFDADQRPENNSRETVVTLALPEMPAPHSLAGDRDDSGFAALTWEYPDLSPRYPTLDIDFEDCRQPSMHDMSGFKSIDVDGNEVYGELGLSGALGFTSFPHSSLAHSGSWMLVSPCNEDGKAKEDWLISTKLSGKEQTVSFYVRTNWDAYETFSVLTSATGDSKEDFTTEVLTKTTTDNDWQRVEITMPEGTLYFAIVCKADDTTDLIYLMLDDFTFEAADANDGLVIEGYNTYRDNILAEKASDARAWKDMEADPGPHFYRVTARYEGRGESASSNEIFLFTRGSGVDNVTVMTGKVYSQPGRIIIEGADGCHVSVTDLNGMVLLNVPDAGSLETVSVPAGVYLVSVDGSSVKLHVR